MKDSRAPSENIVQGIPTAPPEQDHLPPPPIGEIAYPQLPYQKEFQPEYPQQEPQYEPPVSRFDNLKLLVWIIAVTCWILPFLTWLSNVYMFFLIISAVFGGLHLALGVILIIQRNKFNSVRFTKSMSNLVLIFLALEFIYSIVIEYFGLYHVITHNNDNCHDFTMYKVCDKRAGIMTEQVIWTMYLIPGNFLVLLMMIEVRKIFNEHLAYLNYTANALLG